MIDDLEREEEAGERREGGKKSGKLMTVISENGCKVSLWEGCCPTAGCWGRVCHSWGGGEDIAEARQGWPWRETAWSQRAL